MEPTLHFPGSTLFLKGIDMYAHYSEVTLASLKERATLIHYFGLGFVQIKFGDVYRMHIYTEELPPIVSEEDVHNHRYDFHSSILHGSFTQELFEITGGDSHICEEESCREDSTIDPMRHACGIRLLSAQTFAPGSSYHIAHNTFHRVRATHAITLLRRGPILKETAQVIRPVHTQKICPFSKKVPDETLWEIVGRMLPK